MRPWHLTFLGPKIKPCQLLETENRPTNIGPYSHISSVTNTANQTKNLVQIFRCRYIDLLLRAFITKMNGQFWLYIPGELGYQAAHTVSPHRIICSIGVTQWAKSSGEASALACRQQGRPLKRIGTELGSWRARVVSSQIKWPGCQIRILTAT